MFKKIFTFIYLITLFFYPKIEGQEYPLIDKIIVTKNAIRTVPGKHFRKKHLHPNVDHFIEYFDPEIDLREFDDSVHVMPFIFDMLASILISDDTYYVDSLDTETVKTLEKFRAAFKIMYPNTRWDGQLICRRTVEHSYNFSENRILTLFSGGVDSTYSLLRNLDKEQVLFTQKGHVDSANEWQWQETYKISKRFADLCNLPLTTAISNGAYVANRAVGQLQSPDIYDWGLQAIGDLRWMGKAIPLMIHYKTPRLFIPATETWNYPVKSMANAVIKKAFCFGNSLRVYTHGFDTSRTKKTEFITKYLNETFPDNAWTLKVCFDGSGRNCCKCRKCIRTINDLYAVGADPNQFGFHASIEKTKENLIGILSQIHVLDKGHRELETFFFTELLKYLEENDFTTHEEYLSWLYGFLNSQDFIIEMRQRNSNYYKQLEVECEKAWADLK